MAINIWTNIYVWMYSSLGLLMLVVLLIICLIVVFKKTHAMVELKAWIGGKPIGMFFRDDRYMEWKSVKNDAGIVQDKEYGAFIINEEGSYVDKTTKNIHLPFVTGVGISLNMTATKLADDLRYVIRDEKQLWSLREKIARNEMFEDETLMAIRSSVKLSSIKHMMTAMIPHNIHAKIEKEIAARMKQLGTVNVTQVIFLFIALFGAIILGGMIVKNMMGNGGK